MPGSIVVFNGGKPAEPAVNLKALHAKIGQLALESDFLEDAFQGRYVDRKKMIDRTHRLSVTQQARSLGISRGLGVLLAAAGIGRRPGADATAGRIASGAPVSGRSAAARRVAARGPYDRTQARFNADEAHGDRAAVPQAEHQASASTAPGVPVPALGRTNHEGAMAKW
jgi:hypothetical protein